ncbi:MerR family transcriptional regulator [Rhodococcus opacus]|uniref:DNA polymerase III subunit beta family protein n=1 Tax=Rhodococcus opacus TaxID=37919 RepID=UPI0024BB96CE|nr:MerR family transcriptional regulator [Rhodococcus opacus]MDJ0413280.1 MerR family DNA-binding transcriptional regulator [Rhodococcus opacus]
MSTVLSIGELARASGLSVSALRFYAKAGVLTPHVVDPRTGYRWYADRHVDAAVLVAAMRRVGTPVKEMAAVLSGTDAHGLLDRHLGRLEKGLDDARHELTRIHRLLDARAARECTIVLRTTDLLTAFGSVRFAADADSQFPVLRGCLLETDHDVLRLVTTDRYRLAVGTVAVLEPPDEPISAVVPCTFLDDAARLLGRHDTVTVVVGVDVGVGVGVTLRCGAEQLTIRLVDGAFPDHRSLSPLDCGIEHTFSSADLRALLADAGDRVDLGVLESGEIVVGSPATEQPARFHVQVNAGFLLEAVDALPGEQLTFQVGGPITPLAIRPRSVHTSDPASAYSLLMPLQPVALT